MSTQPIPDAPSQNDPPASAVPIDAYLSLVNNLLVFYQHEHAWIQRTRASLELALVRGPLLVIPTAGAQPGSQSDSDGSAPSVASSENTSNTNESTPPTTDSDVQSAVYMKDEKDRSASKGSSSSIKCELAEDDALSEGMPVLTPLTLRASSRKACSRWLKRKQSYNLRLGTLANHAPRPRRLSSTQGPEPSVQLLEQFSDLLDARMESCIRVARLLREHNRATLYTW